MPTYDFITELLKLEDIILKDFSFTVTEIHISFALKRKPTVCPCCGFITEQVHDYRPSTIKDLPLMGKQLFYTITSGDTIALPATNTFMNLFILSRSTVVSPHGSLSSLYIC